MHRQIIPIFYHKIIKHKDMNSFGSKFRISIFGESHGELIGVVMDGVPAGMALGAEDFSEDLARRKSGSRGTTPRIEEDEPEIVSGICGGFTTGAPLTVVFRNCNTRSSDYSIFRDMPRPGHADFVAGVKYNSFNDIRGGGHFSGRITLCLVAAGVVAKKIVSPVAINAVIKEIGGILYEERHRCDELLDEVISRGDSIGGIIECSCTDMPVGMGSPFFDSLESQIAHLAFSIPGVRGVEFGDGFAAARMKGSEHNDPIVDASGKTAKNGAGGINGGISNGNPLLFRVAVKPTSSISREQRSYNFASNQMENFKIKGRHDSCIALRVPVIVEAITAIALANA